MAPRKIETTPRPNENDALWRVAVHEAGHVVAAHAVGFRVDEVSIKPGSTSDGDRYAGITSLDHDPHHVLRALDEYYEVDNDSDDREQKTFFFLIRAMQVSLAGVLAEELFFGSANVPGAAMDLDHIAWCSERLCPPDAQEIAELSVALPPDITNDAAMLAAAELCTAMRKHEDEYLAEWIAHRTRKLVRMRRDIIEAVAHRLRRRKRLTASQVLRTIEGALCRRWKARTRVHSVPKASLRRRSS